MLHTVYHGLFKHMMDGNRAFLKKHRRLQVLDDLWKPLRPYPRFLVPKKADHEIAQWQGKEMRNVGRCNLGVCAVALRQPLSPPVICCKQGLGYVRALVDLGIMAQYRSHMSDTIAYMEHCWDQFHRMKAILLEFSSNYAYTGQG